jgi:hypothetical protein
VHPSHRLQSSCWTDRKKYIAREPILKKYLSLVSRMESFSKGFTVEYIDRNNFEADELAKATTHNTPLPVDVFFQTISDASIKTIESEPRVINII